MITIKIAIVTGGSRGIGKDIALSLAKQGVIVIITYLNAQSEAEKTVKMIESLGSAGLALTQLLHQDLMLFSSRWPDHWNDIS